MENSTTAHMKRILVVGDIHANYPALKSIQSHTKACRFDRIVNTGDTVVYGTHPNETVEWFRRRKESLCILGNTDRKVLEIYTGGKLQRPRKEEKRIMYFWTSANLLPKNAKYLQALPDRTEFAVGSIRIGLFHGTCEDREGYLFPDAPVSRFRKLAESSPYRIHIMGHSHIPFHKTIGEYHFINPGSVGRTFDGDPRTSFAILTISSSGKITVEHFRIPYRVEKVVRELERNNLPRIYKKMYRLGRKLN